MPSFDETKSPSPQIFHFHGQAEREEEALDGDESQRFSTIYQATLQEGTNYLAWIILLHLIPGQDVHLSVVVHLQLPHARIVAQVLFRG